MGTGGRGIGARGCESSPEIFKHTEYEFHQTRRNLSNFRWNRIVTVETSLTVARYLISRDSLALLRKLFQRSDQYHHTTLGTSSHMQTTYNMSFTSPRAKYLHHLSLSDQLGQRIPVTNVLQITSGKRTAYDTREHTPGNVILASKIYHRVQPDAMLSVCVWCSLV